MLTSSFRTCATAEGGSSQVTLDVTSPAVSAASPSTSVPENTDLSILKFPYRVVDTEIELERAMKSLGHSKRFALDIEAFCTNSDQRQLGQISLLQMCSSYEPVVYLVDVVTLGFDTTFRHIEPLMTNPNIQKLMFDCRRDVEALSSQMKLKPAAVLDLQLFFTAIQWKTKSVNRRSGMTFVIKNACGLTRQEGDSAVQAAMTLGNRPVWDVRPLPAHFLEYAADDVRHTLMLAEKLVSSNASYNDVVERLTGQYVEHYAIERPVEVEADPKPHEVCVDWLERFIGPGGKCAHCGAKGHTDSECFKKQSGVMKCTHCGEAGHMSKNCFKKYPHLLKCEQCGQMGHNAARCFMRNKCKHCGGLHSSENCHVVLKEKRRLEREAKDKEQHQGNHSNLTTATPAAATTPQPSSPTPTNEQV